MRHLADCRRQERIARRLAAARSHVLARLRCAMASDVEGFRAAGGDRSRVAVHCRNGHSAQGFVVERSDDGIRTRSVAVDLEPGALKCRYETCGGSVDAGSDQRVLSVNIGDEGVPLSVWEAGCERRFESVDALRAFLLAPILGSV